MRGFSFWALRAVAALPGFVAQWAPFLGARKRQGAAGSACELHQGVVRVLFRKYE
jgi:hypothetical protein